ncbi:hypothetical protein T492DRAFT_1143712 [Pavlovales sp. CCMP2436]|nr:hypothetical protein T492DRAFT_1143712 [Pavlovales sp. CCMP2436]
MPGEGVRAQRLGLRWGGNGAHYLVLWEGGGWWQAQRLTIYHRPSSHYYHRFKRLTNPGAHNFISMRFLEASDRSGAERTTSLRVGDFNVAYSDGLCLPAGYLSKSNYVIFGGGQQPFCCDVPFKPRRLDADATFFDFMRGTGNHPNVVYEVKEQVDQGPLLSTKYYKLCNDNIEEIEDKNFAQKFHAFKNFKCAQHNRFYSVDLYREGNDAGSNFHHMRLNPFLHEKAVSQQMHWQQAIFQRKGQRALLNGIAMIKSF